MELSLNQQKKVDAVNRQLGVKHMREKTGETGNFLSEKCYSEYVDYDGYVQFAYDTDERDRRVVNAQCKALGLSEEVKNFFWGHLFK